MRAIAAELGIRAPSLYRHVADKESLEVALISDALAEIGDVFEDAVAGSNDQLAAIATAYRAWALAHPHLYRLMMDRPLPRERLARGLEDRAGAALVAATDGDPDAARAAFAFAHGMVVLELNSRFPPDADLDAAWNRGVEAFRPRQEPSGRTEATALTRSPATNATHRDSSSAVNAASSTRSPRSIGSR